MRGCMLFLLYLLGIGLIAAGIAGIAIYALFVALTGACWAGAETYRQHRGRPYTANRFTAVWSRAMAPVDPKHWVIPVVMPATDPLLLPGQVTGSLRAEALGCRRLNQPGPHETLIITLRVHNHGTEPVRLAELDEVDLQVWNPEGKVVGTDTTWRPTVLPPGHSCDATVTVRIVDGQPVTSWALGHHPGNYVFFPLD